MGSAGAREGSVIIYDHGLTVVNVVDTTMDVVGVRSLSGQVGICRGCSGYLVQPTTTSTLVGA